MNLIWVQKKKRSGNNSPGIIKNCFLEILLMKKLNSDKLNFSIKLTWEFKI
jgi:hypothetical protein